ncbi:AfsR/SARP family transcriptional regulator [Alloactinosynnema sp. L-07]|uniref:AfsR/SARP family transcriptional regulator n=1 Tax=Alloactinosynnema sp. L-07 TaxID=1653480 RepID=UPI0006B43D05|nr:AfsR/SARP family transcriptional regulator [Alloactinosynnema sp. L-07]
MTAPSTAVQVKILGPLEVVASGRPVPLGGAKPQALLAALLLESGRVVSVGRLIEVIWPGEPPATARSVIQTYVKTLRRALTEHGIDDLIVTRPPGYTVNLPEDTLDLDVFHGLLDQGRRASTPRTTSDLLDAALALWRGPALDGLGETLTGEAARLDELRLTATEERIAADLELGRQDRLLPELTALVGRYPTNERFRGQHMVALYRLGRQSEALASYRTGRDGLVEELGVDPGPELAAIHQAILGADPSLRGPLVAESSILVPAQLPASTADFTGRAPQIAAVVEALTPRPDNLAAPVQVITGRGGSGKSALAARIARQLAELFPDGQLYAELRGMTDAPAEPGEVLGRFLKALGVGQAEMPAAADERAALYRSVLSDRRVLVLLDDAATGQQIQSLLPDGAGCAVLVTARNRLVGLAGALPVDLDVLDADEAFGLLSRIVGADRVRAEERPAREIIEHCGRMPLAIRIAGARLATRQRWPLTLLADRLADERRRLDELSIADLEVRASFEYTYRRLDESDQTALRRLGYLGVPEFSLWILAWLMDTTEAEAERLAERLVDAHLVDFARVDDLGCVRYHLHDLVRIYGRERAESDESTEDLSAAVARVLGGWLTLADAFAAESPPNEIQWRRPTIRDYPVSAEMVALVMAAPYEWFEIEQPALVVGVERAAALGVHDLVRHFASASLGPSFLGVNRFESRERINRAALAAVRRAEDRYGEAVMRAELGQLRYLQDRFLDSRQHFSAALGLFRELGDPHGQAVALSGLGAACREPGRLVEALHFLDQAAALFDELGEVAGVANAKRVGGSVRLERGDYDTGWADLADSLAAYRRIGSRRGEGLVLRSMGLFHRARGDLTAAVRACEQAAAIFHQVGDKLMEAYCVRALAKARLRLGQADLALEPLESSLAVCQAMGDRWGQAVTLRTLGELHLAEGSLDDAASCLAAATTLWATMEAPLWSARTDWDVALLHDARGEPELADGLRAAALAVFRDHGAREYAENSPITS